MSALLEACVDDPMLEDALLAHLDRRYEAAKAAGTLPNTDAAFERFIRAWEGKYERTSVVFRRYLMVAGFQPEDLVATFGVKRAFVDALMTLRKPFDPEDLDRWSAVLAQQHGERVSSVNALLKDVATHQLARKPRSSVLMAARPRKLT